jgi:hypothetical protein
MINKLALSAFLFAVSLAPFVASCAASLSGPASQIHEAPPEGVASCQFLGTVVGEHFPRSIEDAQTEALNRAAERGANTVVWVSVSDSHHSTAMARAYRCSAEGSS